MKRVLLLTEEPITRTALTFLMSTAGHGVTAVEDDERFLYLLSTFQGTETPFDLAVLGSPGHDTPLLQTLQRMHESNLRLPVLLLGRRNSPPVSVPGEWLDQIELPCDPEELIGKVNHLMESVQ
ncbi:MAG: response regulator transcription factor [Calditrichaeota bacterium]|nr:response regulator transcription factor [Calditrichota bacterium]